MAFWLLCPKLLFPNALASRWTLSTFALGFSDRTQMDDMKITYQKRQNDK